MRIRKITCIAALFTLVLLFSGIMPSNAAEKAEKFSVNLSVSMPNNKVGTIVSLQASVPKATDDNEYEYKFVWSKPNWKPWGVVQNFSEKNTAKFKPSSPGIYELYVDVKDKNGNVVTAKKAVNIAIGWSPALTATGSSKVGNPITAKGSVSGTTNDMKFTYKFVWQKDDSWSKGNWGVVQSFDENNSISFIPKTAGKYKLYMDVKDARGNVISKESAAYTVSLDWSAYFSLSAQNTEVGTPIALKASVKNPNSNLKYKYKFVWQKDNSWSKGNWGVIQNFSENVSSSFTPKKPGRYTFYADVTDNFGNVISKTISRSVVLGWTPGFKMTASGKTVGATLTAQGSVSGMSVSNPCTYKFIWQRNDEWSNGNWGVIQNFSSNNKITFKPKANGKYTIYMDVTDKYGNVITKSASATLQTTWRANVPSISLSGNTPNSKATITANPSVRLSNARYKFVWCRNDDWTSGNWGVIQNFSANKTVTFTPSQPGTYTIYSDIQDANGSVNSSSKSFTIKGKLIALTFDDGPSYHTTSIINTLNSHNAKATFFVLGTQVSGHKDIIKRMQASGHEIANHTYNHKQLTGLSVSSIKSEINSTQNAIYSITGKYPKLMRPPYGSINQKVRTATSLTPVLWNVDTLDWKHRNADRIYNHVMNNVSEGDIILFHDIYPSTAKAIQRLVPALIKKGYYPVTVSELFASK